MAVGPFPEVGSLDQYEVGDLSGKFGGLDNKAKHVADLEDQSVSLGGQHSVIGRSVVIHKKEKSFRWVCGTIELEEKKARQIVALASFHEPRHLISGFIRFRQLQYSDGSLSDTWLELSLKHPGANNRNITSGHKWAVFVSGVGEDAFNTIDSVRCLASGYLWNPYLSKTDVDLYAKDCSASNPLRCAMGDLSGRHGSLVVGGERQVIADANLPLTGNYSVMSRSVLVFRPNTNIPLACANIEPDVHVVSNVAIKKNPAFTVAKFMEHMRSLLMAAEWLVVADVHRTKQIANNECVQLSVNFFGEFLMTAYCLQFHRTDRL